MTRLKCYVTSQSLVRVSLCHFEKCILNNYDVPLSQVVKLQNKAVHMINDVPLMEPITPSVRNSLVNKIASHC